MKLNSVAKIKNIYLAGGCFWGVEAYFSRINGVLNTEVGYANGKMGTTSYKLLKETDHAETVKLTYDLNRLSIEEILEHFYRIIDPYSINRQGNDIGRQYRTGIYYEQDEELELIDRVQRSLIFFEERNGKKTVIEIGPLKNWISAEDYHQDYLQKNPNGYCHINLSLANTPLASEFKEFKKADKETLKKNLSPEAFFVTQEDGTDPPFSHEYDKLDDRGIYVDIVSGEPLFSSRDKFDSTCGWPSFSKTISTDAVDYKKDRKLFRERVEVRSSMADSHLGHVFDDGPREMGGLRYCIDGSALKFIPYEEMDQAGYGVWKIFV